MYLLFEDEKVWFVEWGGKIIYLYGIIYLRGVCIFLNFNLFFKLSSI